MRRRESGIFLSIMNEAIENYLVTLSLLNREERESNYEHLGGYSGFEGKGLLPLAWAVIDVLGLPIPAEPIHTESPPPNTGYQKKAIPAALRWEVFLRDNFTCQTCGARAFLEADHRHPERDGGAATLDNLQTLCRSCNARKGARH